MILTVEQRNARASRLRELLENDDVKDAFATIEAELTEEWKNTFDANERENLWRTIRVMGMLQSRLGSWSHADLSAIKRLK